MLIVSRAYLPEVGGLETIIHQIAKIQIENGDDCKALAYSRNKNQKKYIYEGVPVHCIKSLFRGKSLKFSFKLKSEIKKLIKNREIVLFSYPTYQVGFVNKKYKNLFKLVLYYSDVTRKGLLGKIYQNVIGEKFLKNADKIIVSNPSVIQLSETLEKYRDKCIVLPFGVDTEKFTIKQKSIREKILKDLAVENKKLILFVGSIEKYKGIDVLLNSLAQLNDDYRLVIVSQDNLKEKYGEKIYILGLQDKFIQYKKAGSDNLLDFYNSCDVLVLPSTDKADTFGITAVEAMACGLSVITTEIKKGNSYHNIDGVTGRVIKPNDHRALTLAIEEVCNCLDHYTAEKARNRAEEFSLDVFKKRWVRLISNVNKEIKRQL